MFTGAPFPAWNRPRPGWDPLQAPVRPVLGWMTHRFLSIPGAEEMFKETWGPSFGKPGPDWMLVG